MACEFVETFLYPELTLLNGDCSKISREERKRSLRLIYGITIGCLRMARCVQSEEVENNARWHSRSSSLVSFESTRNVQYAMYMKEPRKSIQSRFSTEFVADRIPREPAHASDRRHGNVTRLVAIRSNDRFHSLLSFVDRLVENHPDDTASLSLALQVSTEVTFGS